MTVGYNVCYAESAGHASADHATAEHNGAEHGSSGHDGGGHGGGVTFHNEYSSKYMWRGFDEFDDHGTWHPQVDFHLGGGWAFEVLGYIPIGTGENHHVGINNLLELKYELVYHNTLNEGEATEIQYKVNYIYYDFPKLNAHHDAQEVGVELSYPNLWESGGVPLVPSVYVGNYMPVEGGEDSLYANFRLEREVELDVCPNPLNLYGELAYHDSFDNADHHTDSEITHAIFGFSTEIEVFGLDISPYINYQVSMDGTMNRDDEVWAGFGTSVSY